MDEWTKVPLKHTVIAALQVSIPGILLSCASGAILYAHPYAKHITDNKNQFFRYLCLLLKYSLAWPTKIHRAITMWFLNRLLIYLRSKQSKLDSSVIIPLLELSLRFPTLLTSPEHLPSSCPYLFLPSLTILSHPVMSAASLQIFGIILLRLSNNLRCL